MAYSDLLKDPRWQKKRLQILERDNWQCVNCMSGRETLHVHHIKYSGKPWEIQEKFLVTLCEKCHDEEESLKKNGLDDSIKSVIEQGMPYTQLKSILKQLSVYYELIDCPDAGTFIDIWGMFEDRIDEAWKLKKELASARHPDQQIDDFIKRNKRRIKKDNG